jgi:Protein of unknown function (DUF2934)
MPTTSPSPAKSGRGKNGNANRRTADEVSTYSARRDEAEPTAEQIALRAYEIYEREGRQDGRDLENWLRAEAELRGNGRS